MSLTLQQLFREHFAALSMRHRLSRDMYHAAWCISHCRTAALGGHVNSCPDGHYHQIAYNSCRHRSCPQCQWVPRERWLEGWSNRLLGCPHHHVVFTLPSELNGVWRMNKSHYADVLFAAASETLAELLGDPKYLGGRVGMLAALHTWNQKLLPHIHLHCLVTAGGLSRELTWLTPLKSCLLPRKVLMLKFRGKFQALLRARFERGELQLPASLSPAALESLLGRLWRKPWNVKIYDAYRHGRGVATYLARYLRGGPISQSRLIAERDGQVAFRYRVGTQAGGDGRRQAVMSLEPEKFLLRWLEHVPPRRLQCVRGYGLYGGNQHSQLDIARREWLARSGAESYPPAVVPSTAAAVTTLDRSATARLALTWQQRCEAAALTAACRCPDCGQTLVSHHRFAAGRPPPLWAIMRRSLGAIA